jgi:hypothetical protein
MFICCCPQTIAIVSRGRCAAACAATQTHTPTRVSFFSPTSQARTLYALPDRLPTSLRALAPCETAF